MPLSIFDVCSGCHSFNHIAYEPCCCFGVEVLKAKDPIRNDTLKQICPCTSCIVKLQCSEACSEYRKSATMFYGDKIHGYHIR